MVTGAVNDSYYIESMAGAHLLEAVEALRNAGSSDALYHEAFRRAPKEERNDVWIGASVTEAGNRRMAMSRRAMLFAAFSAEAYINEFIWQNFTGQDRETIDRLPPIEKLALAPRLAGGGPLFTRDTKPLQTLKVLFKRRDELVHPKPASRWPTGGHDSRTFNPQEAAKGIVAVVDAAYVLHNKAPHPASVASLAHRCRRELIDYGEKANQSLARSDDPPQPLWLLAHYTRAGTS